MFIIEGCLGVTIGNSDNVQDAITIVTNHIPINKKKERSMLNALPKLSPGGKYHIEYGGSGCTVHCV